MSEYVTVELEPTDDPDVVELVTNQTLTSAGSEVYADYDAGSVGSPIAQMLFEGVQAMDTAEQSAIVQAAEELTGANAAVRSESRAWASSRTQGPVGTR